MRIARFTANARRTTFRFLRRIFPLLVVLLILVLVIECILFLPSQLIAYDLKQGMITHDQARGAINEYRKTAIQLLGGVVIAIGLYLTWRRIKATEKTVKVTEEGQITDRFSKAVEQLGDERLAVRLGGIFSLERISKDSEYDYWTVIEVLSAYVRNYKPKMEIINNADPTSEKTNTDKTNTAITEQVIPPDIQAIMTVIGRRKKIYGPNGRKIDLEGSFLRGAFLWRADLRGLFLKNVNLEKADLVQSNLTGAYLGGANLQGADLTEAILNKTSLGGANLKNANLRLARLVETDVGGTNLMGAVLDRAFLADVKYLTVDQMNSADIVYPVTMDDALRKDLESQMRVKG